MTNVITFYTHSNTLHLLMNAVVHIKGFISGPVSRVKVTEYCYAKNVKQCIVSPGNER